MDIASPARRSLRESISALLLFIGGLAWIASFWFPAFYTSQGPVEGYWVFITGWMGFGIFQFAWYANLFILLGIVLMYSSPLWGATLSGLAILVATQAFWFNSVPAGEVDMPILHLGQGFWCWYSSIILLGVGVLLGSEATEAEKNQTTTQTRVISSEPRIKKLNPNPSVATAPVVASTTSDFPYSEPIYEAVLKEEVPVVAVGKGVDSVPVAPVEPAPMPFATVPEPELPNFAELSAANEQEYFQLPNEVALKPAYTEHLSEDWPPKMSLVVTPDPFTTEPHLEISQTESEKPEEQVAVVPATEPVKQSAAGYFDPWKN